MKTLEEVYLEAFHQSKRDIKTTFRGDIDHHNALEAMRAHILEENRHTIEAWKNLANDSLVTISALKAQILEEKEAMPDDRSGKISSESPQSEPTGNPLITWRHLKAAEAISPYDSIEIIALKLADSFPYADPVKKQLAEALYKSVTQMEGQAIFDEAARALAAYEAEQKL